MSDFWGRVSSGDERGKLNLLADLRAMRDMLIADAMPDRHTLGCVVLDGEWICSPYCKAEK